MSEFDPAHRRFVSYIDKSRRYYLASGYGNPYRWACYRDVPFTALTKPLKQSRVGLVTTAALVRPESRVREAYAVPTEPPPTSLYTDHLSWHKEATHTRDVETFLPVHRLRELQGDGRIGDLSPRFYGVSTDFSQRRTRDDYAPAILDFCRADAVDVALLIPL